MMTKLLLFFVLGLLSFSNQVSGDALDEDFGYVDVRPGAHMFWVVYHTELEGDWSEHPLIMWLQGGPGASGVGYGNFKELGPYDLNGNLRPGRWTQKANLMFVDNPVGTGYSYVDVDSALCEDNAQIAADLLTLLKSVYADYPEMEPMPFFVYAESYGGKMTADFAVALDQAIQNGEINCNFQGIAMGDSWVSPMDSVNTWADFLMSMGFVNRPEYNAIQSAAASTQEAVDNEQWTLATTRWSNTETVILIQTDGVDFYNVLAEDSSAYALLNKDPEILKRYSYLSDEIRELYLRHVMPLSKEARDELGDFMNGEQADHWNIPDGVVWDSQGGLVFSHLSEDFMKPVVSSVENLLNNSNIHVSVYSGDLDLICDTPGTYLWIDNMNYVTKPEFQDTARKSLTVSSYPNNAAYVQRHERFSLFTILRSGHMVPIDAPEMSLNMIDLITQYGAEAGGSMAARKQKEVKEKVENKQKEENKVAAAEHVHEKISAHAHKKHVQEKVKHAVKHAEPQVEEKAKLIIKHAAPQIEEKAKPVVKHAKPQVERESNHIEAVVENADHDKESTPEKVHVVVKDQSAKREEIKIDDSVRRQLKQKVFAKKHRTSRRTN